MSLSLSFCPPLSSVRLRPSHSSSFAIPFSLTLCIFYYFSILNAGFYRCLSSVIYLQYRFSPTLFLYESSLPNAYLFLRFSNTAVFSSFVLLKRHTRIFFHLKQSLHSSSRVTMWENASDRRKMQIIVFVFIFLFFSVFFGFQRLVFFCASISFLFFSFCISSYSIRVQSFSLLSVAFLLFSLGGKNSLN